MDFSFNDEQRMMADVVGNLLAETCKSADLRRQLANGSATDPDRWRKLAETGMAGILVPERNAGLGLDETDFVLVAEACGRMCLPDPFVDHVGVAVPMLARFSGQPLADRWLDAALSGGAMLAINHSSNPYLVEADNADALLLHHQGEVHLVEPASVRLTRQDSVDPFRRLFSVEWSPASATRLADAGEASTAWDWALERGALFAAAQGLGLAQGVVDLAVTYAKERRQFGRSIGANQAIKHHLATAQVKIEFARPVVYSAAALMRRPGALASARVSHAKLAALEAADLAARTAIQVHGAMGYSWEVDVHFFLKRTLALAGSWGPAGFHRARVAKSLFAGGLATGPGHTFDEI